MIPNPPVDPICEGGNPQRRSSGLEGGADERAGDEADVCGLPCQVGLPFTREHFCLQC